MEIEHEYTFKKDGNIIQTFSYKLEDGADQDFCDLNQEARKKICHKAKQLIETECK